MTDAEAKRETKRRLRAIVDKMTVEERAAFACKIQLESGFTLTIDDLYRDGDDE